MYRKNTAGQYVSFQLVKTADGTAGTGLTPTLRVCKDGTWAAKNASTTITEDTGTGCYTVALAATDINGNNISYAVSATGCVPVCINIVTTAADPTDSVRFGLTALPNATAGANTGLPVVGTQVPNATAGASGGLLISGSNSGTTTFGAMTCTGTFTVSDGIVVTRSTGNSDGVSITGSDTGYGLRVLGGNGATGGGVLFQAQSTNGTGFATIGTGSGAGTNFGANGTGTGFYASSVSGTGAFFSGGNGDGLLVSGVNGHGMRLLANGASKHGFVATGGTSGTCDGISAIAGTGGVPIRGDITGNLTGSVSGAVGSVTGAVASVTGNVGGNVVGSVASVTGNVGGNVVGSVGSVTGNVGGNVVGTVASVASVTNIVSGGAITTSGGAVSTVTTVTDLTSTTRAEPGQGAPGATLSPAAKLDYLYKAWRNRTTQDASTYKLYADDATTVDQKASVSDSGSVFDRGEIATGP